ncbi:MAG: tetratricopeptide repeat protein [Candidatus Methylomirabilis oxyfera]|nr:tetratricopeptide repeat protein [Candidatus Methylomirabilis oxyfera]
MGSLARQRLAAMMSKPDEAVNLAEAALLVAQEEYPNLDIASYLHRLNGMADEVGKRLRLRDDPFRNIEALNTYLFDDLKFTGNAEAYHDPRNSFLNEVLDRRTGIPITISTVYLEVGWRLGMPLHGVGFPGHFLVKYSTGKEEIVLDPFHRGSILTEQDCQDRLDQVYDGRVHFRPDFLAAASKRQILIRILANLKKIYVAAKDHRRALAAVERILVIDSILAPEIRDRGILRMQLDQAPQGIADLEWYVTTNPQAEDVEEVRKRLRDWRQAQASLN